MIESEAYNHIFITDGLSLEKARKRYKERRRKLLSKLPCITILSGVSDGPGGAHIWAHFFQFLYQEPLFLYLTGINQPRVALILDPHSSHSKEVLFIEKRNREKEFWEGVRLGIGDRESLELVKRITGIEEIRPFSLLKKEILRRVKPCQSKQVGLLWHQSQSGKIIRDANHVFVTTLKRYLSRKKVKHTRFHNIADTQWEFRGKADARDIENLRVANQKSAVVFKEVARNLKHYATEMECAAFLDGLIAKYSYFRNSFPSIVACGSNATILHYNKNNEPLRTGSLVLIDFGIRWFSMLSDITRTVPVNGVFNPFQALLYGIVLEAQQRVEKRVKAGVALSEINTFCWEYIQKQCEEKIIQKGGSVTLFYKKQPHFVGHRIGIQVHDGDPFRDYKDIPMRAGWVISNEPGVYGHFQMFLEGVHYDETIGIRIEDDLLVTEKGCVNLSASCPKQISEIEELMRDRKK